MRALLLEGLNFYPTEDDLNNLRTEFPEVDISVRKRSAYDASDIGSFNIIMGYPRPEDLIDATSLCWLQTPSAGVNQFIDPGLYANTDVILTSASGTYGRQIGDHVIGFMIAHNHSFFNHYENMKQKKWDRYFPEKDLFSSTVAVIGFGDLGSQIARKAKALDMRVLVIRRRAEHSSHPSVDAFYPLQDMETALQEADYVVLAAAGTDDTYHMIDKARLKGMKQGSVLINVARGTLVDEEALIASLEEKHLAGAYLDVTEEEPLPAESPLWNMRQVFITAHSSGLSRNTTPIVFALFKENLHAFLEGTGMKNIVDFNRGY